MKQAVYPISALIIGISLIITAFIIRDTLSATKVSGNASTQRQSVSVPSLMTKKQLSDYLQISEQSIEGMIKQDAFKKTGMGGSYDTYQFLPYLKINNEYRFLKTEVDEWLKYKNDYHLE
ncbi:helix-turn-helix domain-containing protein [Bacillus sp. 165]|uniref:helix-turn-helix domain-containing protein n=1 Tax=Bacillus sp. 165 TaxID=1529117 RepID=UPI001ADCF1AE|nr:helix-turn-helix domain-containing protein [Bacillus sp. 165]MBO9128094.1 helix-turn-helix domain-containing protein [Bacillus sp. 165]